MFWKSARCIPHQNNSPSCKIDSEWRCADLISLPLVLVWVYVYHHHDRHFSLTSSTHHHKVITRRCVSIQSANRREPLGRGPFGLVVVIALWLIADETIGGPGWVRVSVPARIVKSGRPLYTPAYGDQKSSQRYLLRPQGAHTIVLYFARLTLLMTRRCAPWQSINIQISQVLSMCVFGITSAAASWPGRQTARRRRRAATHLT